MGLRFNRLVALMSCLPHLLCAGSPTAPAPPSQAGTGEPTEPARLYLEVVVNERNSGEVIEVMQRGAHFDIDAGTLRRLHVLNDQPDGTWIAVDSLPGVQVQYDDLQQRLLLQVPAEWLPVQDLYTHRTGRPELSAGTGLLMNYDLYAQRAGRQQSLSLWSEQRYFGDAGVVSNTGLYRDGGAASQSGYLRYDTRWTQSEHDDATEISYGDVVTGALRWSTAVRIGGVQWSRNFDIRPDLVTYPLPQFAGQAAVPSAVDLFVNGFRAARHDVQPGPFTLGDMPIVTGGGSASIVTTDALGRQVYTTVPFYVSTQLLKPGLNDYAVSLGALRRGYGLRSFAYGEPLAAGVYRRGISDEFTWEGQAQAADGLAVLGSGGLVRLGSWGVADGSLTHSRVEGAGEGWQASWGYQYYNRRGGIAVQQISRTAGYGDASTFASDGFRLQRRLRQLNASWNLANSSVNAGWIDQRDHIGNRSRLVFASYTTSLSSDTFLSVSAGRTVDRGDNQLRVQLSYLLDRHSTVQLAAERSGRTDRGYANYQRSIPSDGGWGWNLGYGAGDGDPYQQASLQYRNNRWLAQAGVYGLSSNRAQWGQLTGSVGVMDGYLFAGNRINDGFALVSTQGTPDVPIMYDNEIVGRTDGDGYLLVSSVPAYYRGRYAVDPLGLPVDVHIPTLERQATVSRGRGTLVKLPVIQMRTATITLVDPQGSPLPPGSNVVHEQGQVPTVVGWDGVVYLTTLHARNSLQVMTPSGDACRAAFTEAAYAASRDLHVTCAPDRSIGTTRGRMEP